MSIPLDCQKKAQNPGSKIPVNGQKYEILELSLFMNQLSLGPIDSKFLTPQIFAEIFTNKISTSE